jgi:peroxiredoxin
VSFDLAGALKDGPVVLFFYPKAFTPTCTIETEGFASKSADFKTAGAKLIGVSGDSIEDLKSFSSEKCGECVLLSDKDQTVMKAYDAVLQENPPISKRTTYVIAPDGKIIFALTDMKDGMAHVTGALDAVQKWKTSH